MGNVRNSLIPFSEVLNTIFQYEQSIGRSDDESWVDSDLLAGNLTRFINRACDEDKILYVNQAKYEYMKKDSLRFDEPQCSPAIENLYNNIKQSNQIVNYPFKDTTSPIDTTSKAAELHNTLAEKAFEARTALDAINKAKDKKNIDLGNTAR